MKNIKEIIPHTVYDFADSLTSGLLGEPKYIVESYLAIQLFDTEPIRLDIEKSNFLLQHLVTSWMNLHIYSYEDKEFKININWDEYNKVINYSSNFRFNYNHSVKQFRKKEDGYKEILKELNKYLLDKPNGVIFYIAEL